MASLTELTRYQRRRNICQQQEIINSENRGINMQYIQSTNEMNRWCFEQEMYFKPLAYRK